MIQPVPKSNKEEKSITRQVNLAVISPPATTEYLHWRKRSEQMTVVKLSVSGCFAAMVCKTLGCKQWFVPGYFCRTLDRWWGGVA
jgi:hypothetical protein